MLNSKSLLMFLSFYMMNVSAEGYYCPYQDLGANGDANLLYDYYETRDGYWLRMGQTGWQTLESYCGAKGDLNQHSDAGEWKCNDSFQLCTWNGNSCLANRSRRPDCRELCQAILDNKGPGCLGNCPNGGSNVNMHMEYCGWSIPKYSTSLTETQLVQPPIITITQTEAALTTTTTTTTTILTSETGLSTDNTGSNNNNTFVNSDIKNSINRLGVLSLIGYLLF
jgi:hypothetical protein